MSHSHPLRPEDGPCLLYLYTIPGRKESTLTRCLPSNFVTDLLDQSGSCGEINGNLMSDVKLVLSAMQTVADRSGNQFVIGLITAITGALAACLSAAAYWIHRKKSDLIPAPLLPIRQPITPTSDSSSSQPLLSDRAATISQPSNFRQPPTPRFAHRHII